MSRKREPFVTGFRSGLDLIIDVRLDRDHLRSRRSELRQKLAEKVTKLICDYAAVNAGESPAADEHVCQTCGHQWKHLLDDDNRYVRQSAHVNGQGPFCDLCHHLIMARRFAIRRGINLRTWVASSPAAIGFHQVLEAIEKLP